MGVGGYVYFGQWQAKRGELYYSGIIEAKDSRLAFQASGRVISVQVREGQKVARDQTLAELDAAEFQSRADQARASLDRSARNVQQLETLVGIYEKTLPADVVRAESSVTTAQRVMDDARKNRETLRTLFSSGTSSRKKSGMR